MERTYIHPNSSRRSFAFRANKDPLSALIHFSQSELQLIRTLARFAQFYSRRRAHSCPHNNTNRSKHGLSFHRDRRKVVR